MSWMKIFQLASRLSAIASAQGMREIPKGDAGLYALCRTFCERLEDRNPGIAQAAGFDRPLTF